MIDHSLLPIVIAAVPDDDSGPELSIVATLYRSASYLDEFYRRVSAAAAQVTGEYEIILVNDGSPDRSLELAIALQRCDPRVRVIDLSRNFGHHRAMMTGLAFTRGRHVFLIDCDLEIGPEVLSDFFCRLREVDADVVFGVQSSRSDAVRDRIGAAIFYAIYNRLSTSQLPANLVTTRLMSRRYVRALLSHPEREMIIGGLWVITGFTQVSVTVEKTWKGATSYNVGRRIEIAVNAVASFSYKPLVLIFYLGVLISGISLFMASYLVIRWAFFGGFLEGWASVIVSVWLLGGLSMLSLGVIGYYLGKVFVEVKQRPYAIVRAIHESPSIRDTS